MMINLRRWSRAGGRSIRDRRRDRHRVHVRDHRPRSEIKDRRRAGAGGRKGLDRFEDVRFAYEPARPILRGSRSRFRPGAGGDRRPVGRRQIDISRLLFRF
jgi:ABC-type transport system involved in Fe-S cluster assembly fused permease/ATPase subunit